MIGNVKTNSIPKPTIVRLSNLYALLENLEAQGKTRVFSTEIGSLLGVPPHSIRKDISFLKQAASKNGYDTTELKRNISDNLGLNRYKKACIVGMGRLGNVITTKNGFYSSEYSVVAGFDNNKDKLTNSSSIPLYPTTQMEDIIRKESIKIGIVTVPKESANSVIQNLIDCGIKGIINFSPIIVKNSRKDVFIRNIFIAGEFNILSAFISQYEKTNLGD